MEDQMGGGKSKKKRKNNNGGAGGIGGGAVDLGDLMGDLKGYDSGSGDDDEVFTGTIGP